METSDKMESFDEIETPDKMETSDVNLGEWDIVNSASLETEEDKDKKEDVPEETVDNGKDVEEVKDDSEESRVEYSSEVTQEETVNESGEKEIVNNSVEEEIEKEPDEGEVEKGSGVEEIVNESGVEKIDNGSGVEEIAKESGVEEIAKESRLDDIDPEYHPHNDSCSTGSDIDIIDEVYLEEHPHHSHPPLNPSLDMSMSSSALEVDLNPETISPPELEPVLPDNEIRRNHVFTNQFFELIFFGFMSTLIMYFVILSKPGLDNFKEMEIRILELQQENSELKSQMLSKIKDGKSLTVEEQIRALKDENSKLSVFMQDLIKQMEQHTIIFKKESEIKGDKSHQHEINKLKEQVNILKTDNDELQKQLVRMRYSVYSPQSDSKPADQEKKESETEDYEQENATEILADEIKALRQKLYSEVEKLKEWKESVHLLMKELENPPKESSKSKDTNSRKEDKYEYIFKDMNDQFAEAVKKIPDFNLSDLVNKYIGVDKKKVKGVFDSVGHFFKKTQEKTKDIFDKNMKADMWNFIGGFRKQWHVLKKSYFEYAKKMQQEYHASRKPKSHFDEKHVPQSEEKTTGDVPSSGDGNSFMNEPQEEFKSQRESGGERGDKLGEATISRNSWVFERAQHRSEIREKGNENARNKRASNSLGEIFSLDENDQEQDSYEQKDMFSMN